MLINIFELSDANFKQNDNKCATLWFQAKEAAAS